jgi:hypothetical protein
MASVPVSDGRDALHPLPRTSLQERVAERVLSHIVQHDLEVGDRGGR